MSRECINGVLRLMYWHFSSFGAGEMLRDDQETRDGRRCLQVVWNDFEYSKTQVHFENI